MSLRKKTSFGQAPVLCFAVLASSTFMLVGSKSAIAQENEITPDSEFVHRMIRPAVAYLKKNYVRSREYGNASLVGLAVYNAGLRLGQSKKQLSADKFLQDILNRVSEEVETITPEGEQTIYAACVTGILLAEVDAKKYKPQIDHILKFVYDRQMSHGGWGYRSEPKGDTSQTQYASLFLWLAKEKKFKVKASVVENALKFLVATQHQSGGFVYKAEPGVVFGEVTQSLTAAGMGSVYLLGDAYGLHGGKDVKKKGAQKLAWLPPSVSRVDEAEKNKDESAPKQRRQIAGFENTKTLGDRWFRQNFIVNPRTWTYYYLYGFERYSSFKERAEQVKPDSPFWYVQGAKFLKENQNGDGSWLSENAVERSKDYSTAFAILFLVRSTEMLIPTYYEVLTTGQKPGLPGDTLISIGDRLISKPRVHDYDGFVELLNNSDEIDWDAFESSFESLVLSNEEASQSQQLATLRRLVTDENAVVRKVAVKTIGKFRDFDNVPFLILALTDPEPEIAKMANEQLKFVSRKINNRKLPDNPTSSEISMLVDYWSQWYLEVDPSGRLLELE